MIDLERIEGIYLYQGITDMRRGIDSLAALASTVMEKKDMLNRLSSSAEGTEGRLRYWRWTSTDTGSTRRDA